MISAMPEPLHKKAATLVRRHGLAGACAHVVNVIRKNLAERRMQRKSVAEEAAFDRRRGVRTSARIDPETLNVIGPHRASAVRYQPISESSFRTLLAALTELLGSTLTRYCFIDLGCGMGKVLLLATEYPFRQVLGVEYAPELAAICEKNLREDRAAGDRRCHAASVVVADAAEFSFPNGPLAVFLFNPFGPPVLASALKHLRRASGAQSSEIYVVYHNAEHAQLVHEAGFTQVWANDGDRIYKLSQIAG